MESDTLLYYVLESIWLVYDGLKYDVVTKMLSEVRRGWIETTKELILVH